MSLAHTAWAAGANPLGLTELEVATGVVLGAVPVVPLPDATAAPLEALEETARQLFATGRRIVVAFSGGRDSSALLATLLRVARREGADEPVAVTARWPDDGATDETEWQEHVARELGVRRWEIVTPGDDVDLLGPRAAGLLTRHGLLWPAAVGALLPMIELTGDGILVSGEGGDEVFGSWGLAWAWSQARNRRAARAVLRSVGEACLPGLLRTRRRRASVAAYQEWLTDTGRDLYLRRLAEEGVAVTPLRWSSYLAEVHAERGLSLAARSMATLCAASGGMFVRPLLDPYFLSALARLGGVAGLGERTEAMTAVFGPLLEAQILRRTSKASFGTVFWGPEARRFAAGWEGDGVDHRLVDADRLKRAWAAPVPSFGTALSLHAAWLATR